MIVVADTSPINYLVLISEVHVLPCLYGRIVVPTAVFEELENSGAPTAVRDWIRRPPDWLEVMCTSTLPALPQWLGPGEREAIALSATLRADGLLMDEWAGRREAERLGIAVIGTLRVLSDAAEQGLTDLPRAIAQLRLTNFRASTELLEYILDRHRASRGDDLH
jgi:predicted nucleic acid-binding protein